MTEDQIKARKKARQAAQIGVEKQIELAECLQEAENLIQAVFNATGGKNKLDWKAAHEALEQLLDDVGDLRNDYFEEKEEG